MIAMNAGFAQLCRKRLLLPNNFMKDSWLFDNKHNLPTTDPSPAGTRGKEKMKGMERNISNEQELEQNLRKLGELYEEGKDRLNDISEICNCSMAFNTDSEAHARLYEILKEIRDLAAAQIQKLQTGPAIAITRNYEKFFTPEDVAWFMVEHLDPKDGDEILEPSAGNGSLVRAVIEKAPGATVFAFEINQKYEKDLKEAGAKIVVIKDFLTIPVYATFTSCIANPPFGNDTDLQAHFNHIRKHVKKGGKIVMIVPYDFDPKCEHYVSHVNNWSKNSDGTTTPIKIIEFVN
jgi:predicted RNA methylase